MSNKITGIEKAAERLKKKLKEEKVSLQDYKISNSESKKCNDKKRATTSIEERHRVKRNKCSFYLSNAAIDALNKVYIARFSENTKIDKSTLICEALDLLYAKQNRRKIDTSTNFDQPEFIN